MCAPYEVHASILNRGETRRTNVVMFRGRLRQARQELGVAVRASFAVLECVVKRGEKLEPSLDSGLVVPYFALPMLSSVLWSEKIQTLVPQKYRGGVLRAQTMPPAFKSRDVQCRSESNLARWTYAMGFMEPSVCSCLRATPKTSMQAPQCT